MIRKTVDKWLEWALCFILSAMVIDVVWQVASRYLLASPSSFTDELAAFLLIWVGILGGAYVYGKGEHLAIDILVERSAPKTKKMLKITIECVVLSFGFTVMLVGGLWLVYTRFLLNVESAALQLNWGYVYLVVPISGLLICYYAIDNLLNFKK